MNWSPEESAYAINSWRAGMSAGKIASELPDKTRNAVIGFIRRAVAKGETFEGRPKTTMGGARVRKAKPVLHSLSAAVIEVPSVALDSTGNPYTILTVGANRCRYIEDEPAHHNSAVCGQCSASLGTSWCEYHRHKVFARPKVQNE